MNYLQPIGNLWCAKAAIMLKNMPNILLIVECYLAIYITSRKNRWHQMPCAKPQKECIYSNVDAVRQASTYRLNENRRHEAFSKVERQNALFEEREKNH